MKTLNEWLDNLTDKTSIKRLVMVVLMLLVVLLLTLTWSTWTGLFNLIKVIFKPFVYGFALAYLIRPAVTFFEKHRIKRGISVPVIIISILVGLGFEMFSTIFKISASSV